MARVRAISTSFRASPCSLAISKIRARTTAPVGVFAKLHDCMPLLLPQDRWAAWLGPATPITQVQALTPSDFYRALHASLVDPAVGNIRNDRPEFIRPFDRQL